MSPLWLLTRCLLILVMLVVAVEEENSTLADQPIGGWQPFPFSPS
jgi:hypothetical protein